MYIIILYAHKQTWRTMKEKYPQHYVESILYIMEQTVVYTKIKAAQIISEFNLDITIDQFAALDAICCNNDICQRDLSKLILKDRSNTGRILNILEAKGFIERCIETKGKRLVKKVYITEKGTKLIKESIPKITEKFHGIFEDVSEEEFAALRKISTKMKDDLSKTTTIQI